MNSTTTPTPYMLRPADEIDRICYTLARVARLERLYIEARGLGHAQAAQDLRAELDALYAAMRQAGG